MSKEQKHYFEIDVPQQQPTQKIEEDNLQENLHSEPEEISFWSLVFPNFTIKSFTFIICSIQIGFYFLTFLYYYITNESWDCVLYHFGAGYEPAIRYKYEVHRFLMPMFLHYNFEHLIMNILCQMMIIFHLEANYPKNIVIFIYFLSSLGGLILSNMVYWNLIKIGCSLALFGCFAFEIIHLINKNHEIIFKSKCRFALTALFCNILALPMLRVYDNRMKIRTQRNLKLIGFYGIIFLYFLIYIIIAIYAGIDKERQGEKPHRDENFHWRVLSEWKTEEKKPVLVDNIGHLGKFNLIILFKKF